MTDRPAVKTAATALICSNCGCPSAPRETRYGRRDTCTGCDWYSWGGKALASPQTMRARQLCHQLFDPVWQQGHLSRGEAYGRLASTLQMPAEDCHFGLMDLSNLRRAYVAALAIRRAAEAPPVELVEPLDQYLLEAA